MNDEDQDVPELDQHDSLTDEHFCQSRLIALIEDQASLSPSQANHLDDCEHCQTKLDSLAANQRVWTMAANYESVSPPRRKPDTAATVFEPQVNIPVDEPETAPKPAWSLLKSSKDLPKVRQQRSISFKWIAFWSIVFSVSALAAAFQYPQGASGSRLDGEIPSPTSTAEKAARESFAKGKESERIAAEQAKKQHLLRQHGGPILKPPQPSAAGSPPQVP